MELVVENLSCARGGVPVLEGVNFTLSGGAALILRGPNGSGKTTLLRTIAGFQPASAGAVHVAADVIAYAGHADGLKATLSVADNLAFWAGIYGTGPIGAALEAFDLVALADRAAQNLSAGQKRRLALARLLVTGRPVWVLDEPTVSLDSESVAMFGAAIKAHLAGGGAALIASHIDLGLAAETLDILQFRANSLISADGFDEAFS
ncbi:MAG: heme ABC exporter ATP-binding protein CcmA [Paracoccaceae bacterium]